MAGSVRRGWRTLVPRRVVVLLPLLVGALAFSALEPLNAPPAVAAGTTVHYTGTLSITEDLDETHPADGQTASFHDVQTYRGSVHVDLPVTSGSYGSPTFTAVAMSGTTTRTSSDGCLAFSDSYTLDGTRSLTRSGGPLPSMSLGFPVNKAHSGGCPDNGGTTATRVPFACPSSSPTGGSTVTYTYDTTQSPGGGISGQVRYTCTGTLRASATTSAVVNSTADRGLATNATTCDTGQTVGGDAECTLRAALQLVDAGNAGQITFAIPSATNPVISPASALPVATNTVAVDATTQGSWVVLSGAGAGGGNGLELDGGGSSVKGLVVNGFSAGAGIVLGGASGVATGNRVGTDVTGTSAVPNKNGIVFRAPGTTIGGTAGTSAGACTGSCNLVSGNTLTQIGNGDDASPPYAAATIQGNWVGLDATGTARLAGTNGIFVEVTSATSFPDGSQLVIGGPATAPGLAPGNRVVGGGSGIAVGNSLAHGAGGISIAGNVVGLLADGVTAAAAGGYYGIGITPTSPMSAHQLVIGGASGRMNVVSGGWEDGIDSHATDVIGNRVGTDVTGSLAVGNTVGIATDGNGVLQDNLVSGNHVGIAPHGSMVMSYGNLVGLRADGEAALPNDIGIGYDDNGAPNNIAFALVLGRTALNGPVACPHTPCNVVSGNRVAGIAMPYSVAALEMSGTYVGTDLAGTRAIPNGVGIKMVDLTLHQLSIGGSTGVTTGGRCTYPCNVIAGNTGAGLALTSESSSTSSSSDQRGSIAGNFIGLAADGHVLLNGGDAQIAVDGSPSVVDTVTIGGTPRQGNVIANLAQPAISVAGTTTDRAYVGAEGNQYHQLGIKAPILRPPFNSARLASAVTHGDDVVVSGATNSVSDSARAPERVQIYASATCGDDPGTRVEVGVGPTTTLSGAFAITVPSSALVGRPYLTAIRTDQDGSSSAFSPCLTGPRVTATSTPTNANQTEIPVASNAGWGPGDYALIETSHGSVVRRVAALGSLILAAPVGVALGRGAVIEKISAPRGDRTAPSMTVKIPRKIHRRTKVSRTVGCADRPRGGVGVAHCPGRIRLSTAKVGWHSLTLRAWDRNGNTSTLTVRYRVVRHGGVRH